MTAEKKTEPGPKPPVSASSAPTPARKAWTPRSPVEVILDQITKQEKRVAELQHDLDTEKVTLTKLLQAKKVLE
jgi:hypothetical protein